VVSVVSVSRPRGESIRIPAQEVVHALAEYRLKAQEHRPAHRHRHAGDRPTRPAPVAREQPARGVVGAQFEAEFDGRWP
jgi:hypothetical protein